MGRYTVSGSGADCKSAASGSGGSIPSLPTMGSSSNGRVSPLQGLNEGSIPSDSTIAASGTIYLVLTTLKARRIGFANTDETSCKDPLA